MTFQSSQTPQAGAESGLRVESASFGYGEAVILREITLAVREGEFLSLLGPSGSGKTTLLRLLAGMAKATSGRILCRGEAVEGPGIDRGMVFQDYSLFPWMTLTENILLAIDRVNPGRNRPEKLDLAEEYLGLVGLAEARGKYPFELSGGMQQRGAIARALALGSSFLLMDEPFGALDPLTRMKLQDLLIDIWSHADPPRTIVFVTHDVDEALYLGDRVVILGASPGRIIAEYAVALPRPRSRSGFFKTAGFRELREQVLEVFRQDALAQLEEGDQVKGAGEAI
ncbi:MAG: ABC transporter ATP-binding protein [Deltaproteobacteria bacterium]|nr:ABC transporter ATP-binding protein [Deltaproteobacteria bacterium]